MTIEIKNLQCISTLLANYADKIISINEGSSSNNRIESLIELAKKNGVKTISSKGDFSAICKQPVIRDIKDKDLDFGEVVLVLDEVQDTRNLGSCLRSASFFGVDSVIIPKNNSADFFNTAAIETSTGGIFDLKLFKATNINVVIEHLKQDGFWVSGFSEHAEASLEATSFEGKNALILGNEEKGLRKLVEKNCDQLLKISKQGQISSLNVAVAAAIALFELKKKLRYKN